MSQSTKVHILDLNDRRRTALGRALFDLGFHAELYSSREEFFQAPPSAGVVMAFDDGSEDVLDRINAAIGLRAIWLPTIFLSEEIDPARLVRQIRAGAVNYLHWPCAPETLSKAISNAVAEAAARSEQMSRCVLAQRKVGALSPRERQVLEGIAAGLSSKEIARDLAISHRTVEIHRTTMKAKLGSDTTAGVVRMMIDAEAPLRH